MRTSNPALRDQIFRTQPRTVDDPMTMQGTVSKTLFSLLLVILSASYTWSRCTPVMGAWGPEVSGNPSLYMMGGTLGGFILSLITIFKPTSAPITVPIYALLEGLALGAISSVFEMRYPGIAVQAVMGTLGTLAALLLAYRAGFVQATDGFRRGIVAATGGIALLYLVSFVLGFFHIQLGFLNGSGPLSIGLSFVIVVVASLNLVLDFDFIERGTRYGAPKYMEWYGAFGLLVTLVWLYLEIIRLLAKTRDRN